MQRYSIHSSHGDIETQTVQEDNGVWYDASEVDALLEEVRGLVEAARDAHYLLTLPEVVALRLPERMTGPRETAPISKLVEAALARLEGRL